MKTMNIEVFSVNMSHFEKTFDFVKTSTVMKALRRQRVEKIYMKILGDIYKGSTVAINIHKVSKEIPIQKGVRQGNTRKLVTTVYRKFLTTWNRKQLMWTKTLEKMPHLPADLILTYGTGRLDEGLE